MTYLKHIVLRNHCAVTKTSSLANGDVVTHGQVMKYGMSLCYSTKQGFHVWAIERIETELKRGSVKGDRGREREG